MVTEVSKDEPYRAVTEDRTLEFELDTTLPSRICALSDASTMSPQTVMSEAMTPYLHLKVWGEEREDRFQPGMRDSKQRKFIPQFRLQRQGLIRIDFHLTGSAHSETTGIRRTRVLSADSIAKRRKKPWPGHPLPRYLPQKRIFCWDNQERILWQRLRYHESQP